MKSLDILKQTKIDIYKSAIHSDYVCYTTTMLNFFGKMQIKNKDIIMKLREINKEDEKKAKRFKKDNLIACTISAICNKYRRTEHIKEVNGIIVIDIDKDKNPDLDVEKAKIDTIKLPYVMLTEISCRGEGIFCVIPYNKENDFLDTWNALYDDFKEIGYIIDTCKDMVRLRFITYDECMQLKEDVEIYDKVKHIEKYHKPKGTSGNIEELEEWNMTKDDLKDLTVIIYLLVNHFNYTADEYGEWLLDGFRLATCPNIEVGRKLFHMISEHSDNYTNDKDVDEKFDECIRTTKYNTRILGYYFNKITELLGPEWRYRANEILGSKIVT